MRWDVWYQSLSVGKREGILARYGRKNMSSYTKSLLCKEKVTKHVTPTSTITTTRLLEMIGIDLLHLNTCSRKSMYKPTQQEINQTGKLSA